MTQHRIQLKLNALLQKAMSLPEEHAAKRDEAIDIIEILLRINCGILTAEMLQHMSNKIDKINRILDEKLK